MRIQGHDPQIALTLRRTESALIGSRKDGSFLVFPEEKRLQSYDQAPSEVWLCHSTVSQSARATLKPKVQAPRFLPSPSYFADNFLVLNQDLSSRQRGEVSAQYIVHQSENIEHLSKQEICRGKHSHSFWLSHLHVFYIGGRSREGARVSPIRTK